MTNPFQRLKQLREAEKLMRESGFPGNNIVEMCQSAIDLVVRQAEAVDSSTKLLERENDTDNVTVKYFVPYSVHYTEYMNGGARRVTNGMTMVDVDGGINNWQQIMGVAHFIKSNKEVAALPNPTVIVNGLFPVAQWVPEKVEVVDATK